MKRTAILLAILFGSLFSVPSLFSQAPQESEGVGPQSGAMSPSKFSDFLKSLAQDVSAWRTQLKIVDIGLLGVSYNEGKLIEQQRDLVLKSIDSVQQDLNSLSPKQTMTRDMVLLMDLQELKVSYQALIDSLSYLTTAEQTGLAIKAQGWARELLDTFRKLYGDVSEFEKHVIGIALVVDATMEKTTVKP